MAAAVIQEQVPLESPAVAESIAVTYRCEFDAETGELLLTDTEERMHRRLDCFHVAFSGDRAQESIRRSGYEVENFGMKQRGQHSLNSILEWGAAEVWLYIFMFDLPINDAYKEGSSARGVCFAR